MKKTFIFGLMAAALGFTACSSDDDLNVINNTQKGMVLRATVEQSTETRATINDSGTTWKFAFATDDNVSVTNSSITGTYYTFTNDGTTFKSEEAQTTESAATWYAYFPSNEVSLVGQSGTMEAVANKYALAGKTASATTGKDGLTISMSPKVAILVIDNQKGAIDINVKASKDTWVSGLNASEDGFTVTTESTKQTLLSATATGKYYVAVPAGVQLSVKDGNKVIKSTGTSGLVAGKYYNITIILEFVDLGVTTAEGNPLYWAECNLGASNPEDPGDYYMWGATALMYSAVDYSKTDGAFSFVDDNPYGDNYKNKWDASLGFNFNNVPFAVGVFKNNEGERNVFTKYTTINEYANSGTRDNITTLQPEDDAATAKNANWRMPKYDEFVALAKSCVLVWTSDYNSTGNAGYIVYKAKNGDSGMAYYSNKWHNWNSTQSKYEDYTGQVSTYEPSDIHIFLPAAGYGNNTTLGSKNVAGCYCSSDLNKTNNQSVGAVNFNKSVFNIAYNYFRSYGFSIRPVTE